MWIVFCLRGEVDVLDVQADYYLMWLFEYCTHLNLFFANGDVTFIYIYIKKKKKVPLEG